MVRANNAIRLREIQKAVVEDDNVFEKNLQSVSISTIDRLLRHHKSMKELYRIPFQRNGDRVKEQRYQYVQLIMELESSEPPYNFIYVHEAGFNLSKSRRLFMPRSKIHEYLSHLGKKVLASFPVQATLHFYNDDSSSEEEDDDEDETETEFWVPVKRAT
ncbi:uncharacterized protein LOC113120182 [Tachysurus ichikawai]